MTKKDEYEIRWSPRFKKKWFSKGVPIQVKKKAIPAIKKLKTNPDKGQFLEPPLQMLQRIRINRFRIAYRVRGNRIYLVYIDHRNVFYANLLKKFA